MLYYSLLLTHYSLIMLKRQIAGNTAAQFTGKIVSTALGIGALMIMTRSLGATQFGWYATANGFLQFIFILSDFGFTVVTSAMLAETRFDKNRLYGVIFSWRIATAVFFQILAGTLIWFFPYATPIKIATSISTLAFFSIAVNQIFTGYYQAKIKTYILAIGELIGRVALFLGIIFAARLGAGFLPMMIIIIIASLANTFYLWIKSEKIIFSFDREMSAVLWKKIWPVALAVIFNSIYLYGDRFLLPLFVPAFEVGFYTAAYRVLDIIAQVAAIVMGIMLPLLAASWSRDDYGDFKKRAQWGFDIVMLLLLPIMAGSIALATPIMRLVGGKEFLLAGPILRILSVAVFGICFGMIFGHILLAIDRQKQALAVYASGAVLSLIGYLIYIPYYGPYGAGYVTIFSEFYAGIMLFALAVYYSKFVPDFKRFFKIAASSIIMGLTVYILPDINVLALIFAGVIIYGTFLFIFKAVSEETVREILGSGMTEKS